MNFRLTQPCGNCPFRTDQFRCGVTSKRAKEISEALLNDSTFSCHKTDRGLSGNMRKKILEHCAGAMIVLEKLQKPNQLMRSAERLGVYSPDKMNMQAPVFDNFEQFIKANNE